MFVVYGRSSIFDYSFVQVVSVVEYCLLDGQSEEILWSWLDAWFWERDDWGIYDVLDASALQCVPPQRTKTSIIVFRRQSCLLIKKDTFLSLTELRSHSSSSSSAVMLVLLLLPFQETTPRAVMFLITETDHLCVCGSVKHSLI